MPTHHLGRCVLVRTCVQYHQGMSAKLFPAWELPRHVSQRCRATLPGNWRDGRSMGALARVALNLTGATYSPSDSIVASAIMYGRPLHRLLSELLTAKRDLQQGETKCSAAHFPAGCPSYGGASLHEQPRGRQAEVHSSRLTRRCHGCLARARPGLRLRAEH